VCRWFCATHSALASQLATAAAAAVVVASPLYVCGLVGRQAGVHPSRCTSTLFSQCHKQYACNQAGTGVALCLSGYAACQQCLSLLSTAGTQASMSLGVAW
jgi:hypothetical protein